MLAKVQINNHSGSVGHISPASLIKEGYPLMLFKKLAPTPALGSLFKTSSIQITASPCFAQTILYFLYKYPFTQAPKLHFLVIFLVVRPACQHRPYRKNTYGYPALDDLKVLG